MNLVCSEFGYRRSAIRFVTILSLLFFGVFSFQTVHGEDDAVRLSALSSINKSVVNIRVDSSVFDYDTPWASSGVQRSSGTGFIVQTKSGNRIITNAHVVSGAININVKRPDQKKEYTAKLIHIAHDCDLAMLQIDDSEFFKDAKPLSIGQLPALGSSVVVVGFPIGGNRLSITRGVVSRIDLDTYAHSGIDSHLIIQVDAAINPGNSGGPALQDGKVIGVAFQALRGGENLGYLIPPVVIDRFLNEIETTGTYQGYVELGVRSVSTENPVMRKALSLPADLDDTGVFVTKVMPNTSAEGFIQEGDILLSIMNQPISQSGDVVVDGMLYPYVELVDHLSDGQLITAKVFRNKKIQPVQFKAKRTNIYDYQRQEYEQPPEYYVQAGLVFQPLDGNLMKSRSQEWLSKDRSEIFYRYFYRFTSDLYKEKEGEVVLTGRLNDSINLYAGEYRDRIVKSINGKVVRNFSDFMHQFDTALSSSDQVVVRFENVNRPLVLRSLDIRSANSRIMKAYSIEKDRRLRSDRSNDNRKEKK